MLQKIIGKLTIAAIAAIATIAPGLALAQSDGSITFGIISTESSQNLRSNWQPVLDDLSRKTGYKVQAFFAPDYAGVIEGMRFKKVDLGWFGNKSAIEAVDRAGGEVFAQTVSADGVQGYYSHLVVHRDSPIKSVEDMLANSKNLTFGNGDPNSTSGFLVPSYYVFAKNKVDPKQAFKAVRSANHETNALSVVNKQIDVATCNSEVMTSLEGRMPAKFNDLRIIWTSPLIPPDPLVMRKDLPAATKQKIKDFFYNYGNGGQSEKDALMKLSKLSAFKPATNDQLIPIRQLELFRARNKVEADSTMPAQQKQEQVAAIDLELANLEKR